MDSLLWKAKKLPYSLTSLSGSQKLAN